MLVHTAKAQKSAEAQKDQKTAEAVNELSKQVIGCGIRVHKALGPGFVEKVYAKALAHELGKQGIDFAREQVVRVAYDGLLVGEHRLDFLVDDEIVLEVKAVYGINPFHLAQTLSYLKATNKRLGLIVNFARARLEVKRVANGL